MRIVRFQWQSLFSHTKQVAPLTIPSATRDNGLVSTIKFIKLQSVVNNENNTVINLHKYYRSETINTMMLPYFVDD